MYRSFSIKRFRCFRDFKLEPLERVNLIAGMNNVGKTALLEALFLHIGQNNPNLSLVIDSLRGIERRALNAREMWGWLFFDKQINETIVLTSVSKDNVRRSLQIRLVESAESSPIPPDDDNVERSEPISALTTAIEPRELVLEYEDTTGQTGTSRAYITASKSTNGLGLKAEYARLAPSPPGKFLPARVRALKDDVGLFSDLERVGRQQEVLNVLRILEPRLRRLAILIAGGVPVINGDIGLDELVPLPLMGEGTGRLLSMVLATVNAQGGTVLIDEIENGLHYSTMVAVWKALARAARQSEVQIFAATHSWECIQAAHEAFASDETYDFRLHRLERVDGDIRAVTYDQDMLATAIATDLEVR